MRNKSVIILLGIGILLVVILVVAWLSHAQTAITNPALNHQTIPVQLGDRALTVEIVNTPESLAQGLSGRSEIGVDGMLFVFDQPHVTGFWMKDMLFNLDLIWIKDGRVVEITRDAVKPGPGQTSTSTLPVYSPAQPIDLVLEVPAGAVDAWGIVPGSRLSNPDASLVDP